MSTLVLEIFDRHLDDILRLNLLKIILSFLLPNKGRNVKVREIISKHPVIGVAHAIGAAPTIEPPVVGIPIIGSSSSATEIGTVVVKTMVVAEAAKTDITFFNQNEVTGEGYQSIYLHASADQTTVISVEEQTVGVAKTEDEASQDEKNWVDQVWSLRKDELSPEAMKYNTSTYRRIGH
ncbi:hypothetical protein GIB67_014153 [Kingdonia uniflora]|uniref:Uncharacterized protein n=1 Tax=Kingdonia uniflora TaxID=39325 RepID=A0A7J7N408_9MAGN|nr:hypothetical protein GIB67_014153 [Kingdonia uniflora]